MGNEIQKLNISGLAISIASSVVASPGKVTWVVVVNTWIIHRYAMFMFC